ncbi:hypothetical protein V5799_003100 [Amblyomma americanum]|uniref:Uncharacterized protein n=1 Tax=Amblyomma americanum TaxID=6943 RepID=A0AAQ4D9X9_AMBAM
MRSTGIVRAFPVVFSSCGCSLLTSTDDDENATRLLSLSGMPKFCLHKKTGPKNFLEYTSPCLTMDLTGGSDRYVQFIDYKDTDEGWR